MSHPKRRILVSLAVLLIAAASAADAAPTDTQRCIADKRKAVGKTFSSLLSCDAKAVKKGAPVDPTCETKANDKLTAQWAKVEGKYGAPCVAAGVQSTLDGIIDAARDALAASQGVPGAASVCTSSKVKAAG